MTADIMEGYALSPQQERLWLLQQGEPVGPYRARCVVRIEGPVDPQLFTAAVQQVVARHEILRTTFHRMPGLTFPIQVIGDTTPPGYHIEDWQDVSAREHSTRLAARWREALQRPFDLAQAPLLQISMVRLAPVLHVLLLGLPALCADRTTLTNLVHHLSRGYAAAGHGDTLPDTPLQYADFSVWQSALLTAESGAADRAYWQKQMATDWRHIALPGAQSACSGFTPAVCPVALAPDTLARITALTGQYRTTPAVFLLACWTLLLWRHIGQADLLVGSAFDGRNYAPLQEALGLFARYLPIRCQLVEPTPFSTLLEQLHTATQEAYHRQEYFTWEIVDNQDEYGPGAAFFPLGFEYAEQPAEYTAAGVSWGIEQLDACTEPCTVKLLGVHTAGGLRLALHYNARALQNDVIADLAEQLQALLASASQRPETAIGQLELLSDAARQRVLVTFNQTDTAYPPGQCLHHLFAAQAARTPDHLAVVCAEQSLTYAALNTRANQLAHHLQRLGVGPQVRVGICLEGALEMLVGIFGILKAGGAYVPMDPTYPGERLAFMMQDVQAPVLLTQARLLAGMPALGPTVVCLDTDWTAIAQHSPAPLVSQVTPEHLAYVIYTSGSTGQPKGVMVSHGNVVHSTRARLTYYRQPVSSFLLLSSFAFDSSVAGLFGTLCQGGTLVLPDAGYQGDLGHLLALISRHHVSHLLSLPSLYALLLEQATASQLQSLQAVIVAGEACPRGLVTRHYERLPETALFNEYGPTEGTVWSSVQHCHRDDPSAAVPIGRPIANTQIYLLQSRWQPLPAGIAGELYIGGAGVTAGYVNRAALTAERFVPHPFSSVPGARLYKTGDLGRHRPDGAIEFLGRMDQQVKIRGFRIELGEVEAALQQHPAVTAAAVVAGTDGPAAPAEVPQFTRLIAYLVTDQPAAPSPGALRHFLQVRLPDYMIPALFVWLEALPHAPNGKVDYRALPAAETLRPASEAAYVAPASDIERRIARLWQEVLRVEKVGLHDNFFDLGGHSLAMVQVHSKLQSLYSHELSLVDMFRYPTISALVSYVNQQAPQLWNAGTGDERAERAERRRQAIGRQRQRRQEQRHTAPCAKGSA